MAASLTPEEMREVELVKKCFERSTKHQTQRNKAYVDRYRSYKGILEKAADVWQSQLSPPYVFQIIEQIFSMIASEHPRSRVMPEDQAAIEGAQALDKLIPIMRRKDKFDAKYNQWVKQALILGNSPLKVSWESEMRMRNRRIYDQASGQMREVQEKVNVMDQCVSDYVDSSDFFWDPSVSRLEDSPYAIVRWWLPYEQLKQDPNLKNVEMLKDQPRDGAMREPLKNVAIKRDKSKLVEILEYWDSDRLIVVANSEILIRSQPNPFWHGKLPFVMATPVPDIYSLEGVSEVELIMDIQAAIWLFLNQRIDNTRLISNAIIMVRDTIDDPDKIIFEPGAVWEVNDPGEIQMWTPNQNIGQASLEAENELKNDLLNITAAMQYLGGAAPDQMQNNTATGVSLMSNTAQGRVITKRQNVYDALGDKGEMEVANIQQFWRGPIDIRIPGQSTDTEFAFKTVHAQDVLCNACYDIENATESMNRQERRDEAMQLFQLFIGAAQAFQVTQTPFNFLAPAEFVLDAFDIKDPERWTSPPVQPQLPAGAPNGNGAVPPAPGNPGPAGPGAGGLMSLIPNLAARLNGNVAAA